MPLARWIMDRAVANPPKGREEWAAAMRAEFETLETGRFGWALGCWRTMAGWRLQADWLFLLGLVAVPLVIVWEVGPRAIFALAVALPADVFKALFLPLGFLGLATGSAVLAYWRPERMASAAAAGFTVSFVHGLLVLQGLDGWGSLEQWELYNAPPLVGGMAMLAACILGAWVGGQSRRFFRAT